ncbi:hypothetical protein RND71_000879 [Anisodus tanguticus]|uniref:Uncharacterized protein n=1 Tax=Anisodus tanguticus TaxID=243964 RepID=A0AAE1SZR4_9SOLA|nr:hypothetical protein RND71_000879 [Anisodus tanguticus]
MSANSQSNHFWELAENDLGYYQALANYYVSRNNGDHYAPHHASAFTGPTSFDYIPDPYLWDVYAAYFHDNYSAFIAPRHTYNEQSSFKYVEDPYLWDDGYNQLTCEFIDNVYDTNENKVIDYHQAPTDSHYVLRNIDDHYFAPHNLDHSSAFTGHGHTYNGQSLFDHTEDPSL